MKRENLSGRILKDIRPRQSACTTLNWLFEHTLYTLALKFEHLQSNGVQALLTAVTVLICACTRAPSLQNHPAIADSLLIHINSTLPYDHLDILVYKDTLTQPLESHFRFGSGINLRIPCHPGSKIVAAIADIDGELAEGLVPDRFSTLEQLSMNYADENPYAPLQSGYVTIDGKRRCELALSPLLCTIEIGEISIDGDYPLLDPVAGLTGVSASADIFRYDGFHPSYTLDGPETLRYPMMMLTEIPFDIGNTPREAGIRLYCYPNEDEYSPGGSGTSIIVSGIIEEGFKQFDIPLGPLRRGGFLEKDIILK